MCLMRDFCVIDQLATNAMFKFVFHTSQSHMPGSRQSGGGQWMAGPGAGAGDRRSTDLDAPYCGGGQNGAVDGLIKKS